MQEAVGSCSGPHTGDRMVRIGLIGAGRIGTLHTHAIRNSQACRLTAVFSEQRASAATLASLTDARVCDSAAALVNRQDVDAVFICSPTDTHVEFVALAAKAGKAIFCEKPIDLSIARVTECMDILEQYPVLFTVGFHRRFDPHHRVLLEQVKSGRIGRVEQVRIVSRDPSPPPIEYIRRSGGIFRDMMIHDLDQCRLFLGEEPVGVFAVGSSLIDRRIGEAGDFDTATATFWTDSGATCTIQNSRRCSYGFDQRLEVFGATGRVAMENVPLTQTSVLDESGLNAPTLPRHFPQRYQEAYRQQLGAFAEAVSQGRKPEASARDGLRSLILAEAAGRSARTHQPVTIAAAL